jgi:hypothetical protein
MIRTKKKTGAPTPGFFMGHQSVECSKTLGFDRTAAKPPDRCLN